MAVVWSTKTDGHAVEVAETLGRPSLHNSLHGMHRRGLSAQGEVWLLGHCWDKQNAYAEGVRARLPFGPWCARGSGTMQV